jgi:hypothetical protein
LPKRCERIKRFLFFWRPEYAATSLLSKTDIAATGAADNRAAKQNYACQGNSITRESGKSNIDYKSIDCDDFPSHGEMLAAEFCASAGDC